MVVRSPIVASATPAQAPRERGLLDILDNAFTSAYAGTETQPRRRRPSCVAFISYIGTTRPADLPSGSGLHRSSA
jgi:hypothetical protein